MICAPSHVIREGRDLNQHGQAARHEQASSSSPFIFHEVLLGAPTTFPSRPKTSVPHTIETEPTDLTPIIPFILCVILKDGAICEDFKALGIPVNSEKITQL